MHAAFFLGNGRIKVQEVPIPNPVEGEVLVRVAACGLCGSERFQYSRGTDVVPGHESAGTIVETGSGTLLTPGTHGSIFLVNWCGRCWSCRRGNFGRCSKPVALYGFSKPGGFEEFMIVRESSFIPVPENILVEEAVMLLDVCGTTGHALRRGGIKSARTVAVFGTGPIGLGAILMAQLMGRPKTIYATEIVPYRIELAKRLGAKVYDATKNDWLQELKEIEPEGIDLVLDATGKSLNQRAGVDLCAHGGSLVLVGHGEEKMELVGSRDLIHSEKSIIGSEYFRIDEFEENMKLLKKASVSVDKIITHKYPLEEIEKAYQKFWSGETGKVLIGSGSWEGKI